MIVSESFICYLTTYILLCLNKKIYIQTNRTVENIGARRLHTVIERVMEEISFDAPEKVGETVEVTEEYVKKRVGDLLVSTDMRKYIL